MKAIYRKRLERLAQLLENWSVEKKLLVAQNNKVKSFDIHSWQCGTAACALGSAAMLPEFNKSGLKIEGAPTFKGHDEYRAGEKFFGITYDQSLFLFNPLCYESLHPTPKTVAKRVREILEGKA